MKKKFIKKLQKAYDLLSVVKDEMQDEIGMIEEKMENIEDRACERESGEMTEKEFEKYQQLEEEKEELETMVDELENNCVFDEIEDEFEW